VAADSRSRRDGRFLEKIGTYDPVANPAKIIVDHDATIKWLQNGAQPSDTVKAILRYTGVNLKFALIKQGKSEEEIERIFGKWQDEKEAKIVAKKDLLREEGKSKKEAAHKQETVVRATKAAAIAKKHQVEEPVVEAPEAPAAKVVATPAAEAPAVETAEAPAAEAEAPAVEAEAPAAEPEVVEEAPVAKAEAPAAEVAPEAEAETPAAEPEAEAPAAEADVPAKGE
jgi:small subunit ribosomal protein S16